MNSPEKNSGFEVPFEDEEQEESNIEQLAQEAEEQRIEKSKFVQALADQLPEEHQEEFLNKFGPQYSFTALILGALAGGVALFKIKGIIKSFVWMGTDQKENPSNRFKHGMRRKGNWMPDMDWTPWPLKEEDKRK